MFSYRRYYIFVAYSHCSLFTLNRHCRNHLSIESMSEVSPRFVIHWTRFPLIYFLVIFVNNMVGTVRWIVIIFSNVQNRERILFGKILSHTFPIGQKLRVLLNSKLTSTQLGITETIFRSAGI